MPLLPALDSRLKLSLLGLLLVPIGMAVYWAALLASHQDKLTDLERQTQLRAAQLAKTLAVQTQTLFAGLDFLAQNLVAEYKSGYSMGFELAVQTATSSYPPGSILQISVANREGEIVYSSLTPPSTSNSTTSIRDRAHFKIHQQAQESGMYISHPVMGRVSQLWTIQITRAIRQNGQFEGVVVVSVAPSYLSGFFREILEQPRDVILLLRDDGAYLARSHAETQALGKFDPSEREFLRNPSMVCGAYDAYAFIDGVLRHYAWHRVSGLPLLVSIGLDKEAVWTSLRAEIQASLMRNAFATALLSAAALAIGWLLLQGRKHSEQASHSQNLLQQLVTQIPGALFQLRLRDDGGLELLYASPGLFKLHQTTSEQVENNADALFEHLHPDDAQRVQAELRQATAQMTGWQSRYRLHDSDGHTLWLQASAQPERHSNGSVLWHGYVQDMTQEHEMQEALRLNEQHLRLTMEAVNDGLWRWELGTQLLHWDARCWEMLGYPAHARELTYATLLGWVHPSDRALFQQRLAAHMERGEHYHCEFRLRTASGKWLWIEARGNVCDTIDGKPARLLGTHTDISERVAQALLRRALLEENAAAIVLATPDRRVTEANQRAQNMFGLANHQLEGKSLAFMHPDTASFEAFGACYADLRTHGIVRRQWLLRMGDGSLRWCDLHGSLLDPQDPHGKVIWTIMDADDRHRTELALRTAEQRLMTIIECFPSGVMVQEGIYGPIVAMNQVLCDLLGVPAPSSLPSAELEEKVRQWLPAEMQHEPQAPLHKEPPRVLRMEQSISRGRTIEIHRIPLWKEGRYLGLFWMLHDITQRKQRELTLERLASTDTLTTLPNRRAFMDRLQQEWEAIRQHHAEPGVLIMFDIDYFKTVNDTWGHAVGDQVLQHLSLLLRQGLRSKDIAARLGGEEFAVLLTQTRLDAGLHLAERLRTVIADRPTPSSQGSIPITISMGVSVLDSTSSSIDESLAHADTALYQAKRQGRNQICAWDGKKGLSEHKEKN